MPKNNTALAAAVRDWIETRGLTQTTIAARGGPSTSTMTKVLSGEGSFRGVIFAQLDRGLGWGDGVAERHWFGQGVPVEAKGWREASDDELLAELHRRMERRREIAEWMERYRPKGLSEKAFEELVAAQLEHHDNEGGGVNGQASTTETSQAEGSSAADLPPEDRPPSGQSLMDDFERVPERGADVAATDERGVPPRG